MGSHQKQNEKNFTLFVSYCGRGQQILVGEPWRKGFFGGLVRVKKTDIFWTIGFLTQQCGQNFCEISGGGRGGSHFFIGHTKC